MTTTSRHLRLVPSPTPTERWISAVRRESTPLDLSFAVRARRASHRSIRPPASVAEWIADIRRAKAA
jgi:hypothetical protein